MILATVTLLLALPPLVWAVAAFDRIGTGRGAIVMGPIRNGAARPALSAARLVKPWSTAARPCSANCRKTAPSRVRAIPALPRCRSVTPSICSRSARVLETVGWVRNILSAAPFRLPHLTVSTNAER